MKILHVAPGASEGEAVVALAQRQAQDDTGAVALFRQMARPGASVGTEERSEQDGLLTVTVFTGSAPRADRHRLRWDLSDPFRKFVHTWQPEVVHFHRLNGYSLDFPQIARTAGARTVLSLADNWFTCPTAARVDYQGDSCRRLAGRGCLPCIWKESGRGTSSEMIARLARSQAGILLHLNPVTDVVTDWTELSQRCLENVDLLLCSEPVATDLNGFGLRARHHIIDDPSVREAEEEDRVLRAFYSSVRK